VRNADSGPLRRNLELRRNHGKPRPRRPRTDDTALGRREGRAPRRHPGNYRPRGNRTNTRPAPVPHFKPRPYHPKSVLIVVTAAAPRENAPNSKVCMRASGLRQRRPVRRRAPTQRMPHHRRSDLLSAGGAVKIASESDLLRCSQRTLRGRTKIESDGAAKPFDRQIRNDIRIGKELPGTVPRRSSFAICVSEGKEPKKLVRY